MSATGPSSIARKFPITLYFFLTFAVSWGAAFALAAPQLLHREPLPKLTGILMFPAMLMGPAFSGLVMTCATGGAQGLRDVLGRMRRWRIARRWYLLLLLPSALVLTVLFVFRTLISAAYTPNLFLVGVLFGVPAGLLEEIGWMGFTFPHLWQRGSALSAALWLGLMWSLWHLPVINFLGAAVPHGRYWFLFFLVFGAAMCAVRVILCWAYCNTGSVLLMQLLHAGSTGALVIFSPPCVAAGQEVLWYAAYAALLWLVVRFIVGRYGVELRRSTGSSLRAAAVADKGSSNSWRS